MPNSVDGSVPASGDHRRAQFRFGQFAALVDQQLLHQHLPAGADGAG